jgi:ornithine cyclodeaminase/alanine dehydrogenase-like protein (mu-crystallin family)
MPLLLAERDVRALVPLTDLIPAMETALAEYSAGRVTQPVRSVVPIPAYEAFFGVMPAAIETPATLGAKLVTVYPGNRARGLPSHLAAIVLFDYATGALAAVLDGRYITEARTAAVSAVSVKCLARPHAQVLAVVGSGVQARSHCEALQHVAAFREIRVWSPSSDRRDAFARELSTSGLPVRSVSSASVAVRGADVIVLATSSPKPVIAADDVGDGAHICAVGACRPDQREMSSALIKRARVFVDSRAGALQEAGDLLLPISEGVITEDHIAGELGEVLIGRVPGRTLAADITIFKSLGMAVEDVAAARLAVERAPQRGLGYMFRLT